jgi:hypothetical protein
MSLIPSESYSFPDHFSVTRTASRKPKNIEPEPEPEPLEPPPPKPKIVALPNPEPLAEVESEFIAPELVAPIVEQKPAPRKIAPPVPIPLRRASAPPPRVSEAPVRKIALPPSLKPKVRWNNRAPAMNPAPPVVNNGNGNGNGASGNGNGNGTAQIQPPAPPPPIVRNVIQMKAPLPPAPRPQQMFPPPENFVRPVNPVPAPRPAPPVRSENLAPRPAARVAPARPVPAPKQVPRTPAKAAVQPVYKMPAKPAPRPAAIPNPQSDFFEMFAESNENVVLKRRHKEKMRRFVVCEGIAVGILLPLMILGLTVHAQNIALHWILNILTISAAVAAALIPILFFALTPTLPEIER